MKRLATRMKPEVTVTGQLDCVSFGRELIKTKDLDPVYCLLWEAFKSRDGTMDREFINRWLLGYWAFYHMGTASYLADAYRRGGDPAYWTAFNAAAISKDYPRCPERRHFRGENATSSVAYLQEQGIDKLFAGMYGSHGAEVIRRQVEEWVGFGSWISFKAADMLERLNLCCVEFNESSLMYDAPLQGARMLWGEVYPKDEPPSGDNVGSWAADWLMADHRLGLLSAPPRNERKVGYQEIETVLCKWKAHRAGHYHIGEDIQACRKGIKWRKNYVSDKLWYAGGRLKFWATGVEQ